jgi:protein gp37
MPSKIEWTDETWNPVTGCTKTSEGCKNCYAERVTKRFWPDINFSEIKPHYDRLEQPLKWRKPRKIFVCSMSDLFHEEVPFNFIDHIFAVMGRSQYHTFMILTKRPQRMLEYLKSERYQKILNIAYTLKFKDEGLGAGISNPNNMNWWPHVWLGVTVENQKTADERIPILLQIFAKVRFVSIEPMLGPVDLSKWLEPEGWYCENCQRELEPEEVTFTETHDIRQGGCGGYVGGPPSQLDWVICGGESGPSARPIHPDWVRRLRDQCKEAGVPFFLKQMHVNGKLVKMPELDGKVWDEFPQGVKILCKK